MKARQNLFSWMAIAVLATLASMGQSTTQTASQGQAQAELPLKSSTTTTLTGALVPASTVQIDATTQTTIPAGCAFSLSLAPGQQALEARQVTDIAVDTGNNLCTAQFEVGEPQVEATPTAAEAANAANTMTTNTSATPTMENTGSLQPEAVIVPPGGGGSTVSAGYFKSWWIDPINITVNSVQNSTTWRWSGSGHCVTGLVGGQTLTWFSPSGWQLRGDSWQNTYNCSETTSASTVHYANPIFCALVTTYATYSPNKVNGLQNGTLVGTAFDSVYGSPCVSLLRFRFQIRRTQN